ncbi:hypothetical protein [Pseudomonas helleri]|uniref:hypothetical protein n=1 Tax=Pseudomonas helleri TaxID=1608996 RepID=UPI003FD50C6D
MNHHHGPIRLHLIGQPFVGIELGFDCAVEIAVANGQAQRMRMRMRMPMPMPMPMLCRMDSAYADDALATNE